MPTFQTWGSAGDTPYVSHPRPAPTLLLLGLGGQNGGGGGRVTLLSGAEHESVLTYVDSRDVVQNHHGSYGQREWLRPWEQKVSSRLETAGAVRTTNSSASLRRRVDQHASAGGKADRMPPTWRAATWTTVCRNLKPFCGVPPATKTELLSIKTATTCSCASLVHSDVGAIDVRRSCMYRGGRGRQKEGRGERGT
ncbi:hypothetical protein BC826DRAFT_1175162 [Russula brevipes]|nr:hypothetical protein BC826DRAFT_1175162 [Russula brevipes]